MNKEDKPFKQVNIAASDWHEYNDIAQQVAKELGVRVSIPALLRMSVTRFKETKDYL